jgi:hypothetical protein
MKNLNASCSDIKIENASEANLDLKLNIKQKLALFDQNLHRGEVMASAPIGKEIFNK